MEQKLILKATKRGWKRCPTVDCDQYTGQRAKACKTCQNSELYESSNGELIIRQKQPIVELQNSFGNNSQRLFAFNDKEVSKSTYGVIVLEQDVYSTSEMPLYKVFCYLHSCVSLRSVSKNNVTCQHGPACANGKSVQSKCLALHWDYIFTKLPSIPESVLVNLNTIKKVVSGFNFSAQPVQKIDSSTYAVFGPKSATEPHGVSFVTFDLKKKEFYCSCESFVESGTSSSYEDISGQVRVCYHVYLLLAAFLSDFNSRERVKMSAQFCHLFLQDTVDPEIRENSNGVWSTNCKDNANDSIKDNQKSASENMGPLKSGEGILICPDLYICNIVHQMREAMQPLIEQNMTQTCIETQIPSSIFAVLEPKIAGKFGNEWKPIPPKRLKEGLTKQWEILVSKTFNSLMTLTVPSVESKYGSKMSLEKFFMMDSKEGAVEVSRSKIDKLVQNCFEDENDLQNQTGSKGNSQWDQNGKVNFQKVKPSFFSSQVVVGRHPTTSQALPCIIEWQESSPCFGTLKITFYYAKKVNGCFV